MIKPHIAVVGAGIVGICSAYFLNKSGFQVTLIDKNDPGSMTSYGHACTFADYACIPVNSPDLFKDIPSMLLRSDGPLAIDIFYLLKNLNWGVKFLQNCTKNRVNHITNSLGGILNSASISYDEIFSEVNVSKFIKKEEALYLYQNEKEFLKAKITNKMREKNGVKIKILSKNEIRDLEPNLNQDFYNGQLFLGSRHTTNPLAISKEIFQAFIDSGGRFIKSSVENISPKDTSITLTYNQNNYNYDKVVTGSNNTLAITLNTESWVLDTTDH